MGVHMYTQVMIISKLVKEEKKRKKKKLVLSTPELCIAGLDNLGEVNSRGATFSLSAEDLRARLSAHPRRDPASPPGHWNSIPPFPDHGNIATITNNSKEWCWGAQGH